MEAEYSLAIAVVIVAGDSHLISTQLVERSVNTQNQTIANLYHLNLRVANLDSITVLQLINKLRLLTLEQEEFVRFALQTDYGEG